MSLQVGDRAFQQVWLHRQQHAIHRACPTGITPRGLLTATFLTVGTALDARVRAHISNVCLWSRRHLRWCDTGSQEVGLRGPSVKSGVVYIWCVWGSGRYASSSLRLLPLFPNLLGQAWGGGPWVEAARQSHSRPTNHSPRDKWFYGAGRG